jgi:type II secretory pathway pseudopilin PulG
MAARGFTYLGLLFGIALMSMVLAATATVWSVQSRRDREAMLLFVGEEVAQAIASYHDHSPAGLPPSFPKTLQDLVDDRRWPVTRRHLRRVPIDPMTGGRDWGVVATPEGTILGIYSRSEEHPLKRSGFRAQREGFAAAQAYAGWRFVYVIPDAAAN